MEELAYDYPLYRPPSEANSTILQVTLGCSFNHCSFCSMYRTKFYQERSLEEIKSEIDLISKYHPLTEKIFLADGDALNLKTDRLVEILDHLNLKFNNLRRISCYAMPKNLMQKKGSELERLRERGLSMLYVGIESGNDVVLQKVTKGASSSMIIESCNKALNHEFTLSCMIILGLGGRTYSDAHISDTATVMSQISPHYLAALNLQLDETVRGEFMSKFGEPFFWLTDLEILDELEKLTVLFDPARQVIFRANHASNVYSIGGSLPSERSKLQRLIHELKNHPEMLRPRIVRRF
ncbi:MAG TPA: radical SAM protein [Nitrososphaeraceae archaeon]|nr:radical SAM protein [Nitrososphaeraceae archaeon]